MISDMKIIFVRHGKDDDRYRGGWSDKDLTSAGILQAQKLGAYLKCNKEIYNISLIVSSDLQRAVTTAEILSNELGIPVVKEFSLREINNGDLSGMLNSDAEIRYPELYFGTLKMDEKYPNGESPNEFYERIKLWFESFIYEHKNDGKNILVVTHGGVINIIYHIVKGIEWSNKNKPFSIPNCSMHILNVDDMEFEVKL